MTTLTSAAAVPSQRSRPKKPAWRSLPHFTGDVAGIAAALRREAAARPDGDCVQAVIMIEAIQDNEHLAAAAKARLTAVVIAAVQLVRGWDAPLAVDEPPVAGLPVDPESLPAGNSSREEVGADGCGCPVTVEMTAAGADVDGTERVEHRAGCWNAPAVDAGVAAEHRAQALEAVELGDTSAVAFRLAQAGQGRPGGECVEAVALIARICDGSVPMSAVECNRRVMVVIDAVERARRWTA
jgi:hypothetical protein